MKAKRVLGIVATVALSVSTVIGPAMPVYAEAVDGAVVDTQDAAGEETPAPATDSTSAEQVAAPAETQVPEVAAPAETQVPEVAAPAEVPADTQVPAAETPAAEPEPVIETPAAETHAETPATEETTNAASEEGDSVEEAGEAETEDTEESTEDEAEAQAVLEKKANTGEMNMQLFNFSDDEGDVGIATDSLENSQPAETSADAYTGIQINGDFTQWDAVEKTTVEDGNVKSIAMVFDKDVYIYVEGENVDWGTNDIATGAGVHNDGMFVLTTDTGRQLVFYLKADKDVVTDRAGNAIEGSEVYYDNETHQFEIKIPSTALKQYKETVSLGYYLDAEVDANGNVVTDEDGNQVQRQIISDVADISQSGIGTTPNEITFDGNYGDWDSYSHHLIQYSDHDADAEGALYSDGDNLMMHVQTYNASGRDQINNFYQDIAIRFNHDEDPNHTINIKMCAVDANGNITYPSWQEIYQTQPGTYEYYLYDLNGWGLQGRNINDPSAYADQWNGKHDWIFGKIVIKVTPTGTEMEVQADMNELADRLSNKLGRTVNTTDLKYIQTKFVNIGKEWISCAGTSTGPIPGILMGVGVVAFAAWGLKKKEEGTPGATEN